MIIMDDGIELSAVLEKPEAWRRGIRTAGWKCWKGKAVILTGIRRE